MVALYLLPEQQKTDAWDTIETKITSMIIRISHVKWYYKEK